MRPYRLVVPSILALGLAFGALSCDDPILPSPIYPNAVDTASLAALEGTPVSARSAYDVGSKSTVRTDVTTAFDFIFNIDTLNRAVLIPSSAFQISGNAGLLPSTTPFADLRSAPNTTYTTDSAVVVLPGDVVVVRSRVTNCVVGVLPYYAKLRVIGVDAGARRITFEILANINCGYRSLEPGLPTQ